MDNVSLFNFEIGKCYKSNNNGLIYRFFEIKPNIIEFQFFGNGSGYFIKDDDEINRLINITFYEVHDPSIKIITLEIPQDILEKVGNLLNMECLECPFLKNCTEDMTSQGCKEFFLESLLDFKKEN